MASSVAMRAGGGVCMAGCPMFGMYYGQREGRPVLSMAVTGWGLTGVRKGCAKDGR